MREPPPIQLDHDGLWKNLITVFIEEFIRYFLPEISLQIDFSKEIVFLEQEFQEIARTEGKDGKSYKDKLVKVFLTSGKEQWILIHTEVQSSRDLNLPKRMFVYYYRIIDRYDCEVIALAIYTHDDVPKLHDRYYHAYGGTEIFYKFNARIIKDYSKEQLFSSDNTFAIVILAVQYLNETKEDKNRLEFKKKLSELLVERGYSREQIFQLLIFIKFLLKLPLVLEKEFNNFIRKDLFMNEVQDWKFYADIMYQEVYGESIKDIRVARDQAEAKSKMEEAKRKEEEARRKKEEARRKKEEAKRKEEEARRKEEEARRKEEEAERKEANARIVQLAIMLLETGTSIEEVARVSSIPIAEVKKIQADIQ